MAPPPLSPTDSTPPFPTNHTTTIISVPDLPPPLPADAIPPFSADPVTTIASVPDPPDPPVPDDDHAKKSEAKLKAIKLR